MAITGASPTFREKVFNKEALMPTKKKAAKKAAKKKKR